MWESTKNAIEEKPFVMSFLISILLVHQIHPFLFGNQTRIEPRYFFSGTLLHHTIYHSVIILVGIYAEDASETLTNRKGGSAMLVVTIVAFVLVFAYIGHRVSVVVRTLSSRSLNMRGVDDKQVTYDFPLPGGVERHNIV